jgi:hypothetical protein
LHLHLPPTTLHPAPATPACTRASSPFMLLSFAPLGTQSPQLYAGELRGQIMLSEVGAIAVLTSGQEVSNTPGTSTAVGFATVLLSPSLTEAYVSLTLVGIQNQTSGHLHMAGGCVRGLACMVAMARCICRCVLLPHHAALLPICFRFCWWPCCLEWSLWERTLRLLELAFEV